MRVMPEAGQPRVLECHQSATGTGCTVQRKRLESAAREVSLQDQRVVARAENDALEDRLHQGIGCRSNREGSNRVVTPNGAAFAESKATRPSRMCRHTKPSRCLW